MGYHSGVEGIANLNGVDWNVTEWDFSEETGDSDTTNTGNYDATSGRTATSRIGTTTESSGSFTFPYKDENDPMPGIRDGTFAVLILTRSRSPLRTIAVPVYVKTFAHKSGGMQGHQECTINWVSNAIAVFA